MTTIPKLTTPTSGLTLRHGRWLAEYTQDGKRRRKALGTADLDTARKARDLFYADLRLNGAITAGDPALRDRRRHSIDPANPKRFIHLTSKPWRVQVGDVVVGHYASRDEAVVARNTYLGLKP